MALNLTRSGLEFGLSSVCRIRMRADLVHVEELAVKEVALLLGLLLLPHHPLHLCAVFRLGVGDYGFWIRD